MDLTQSKFEPGDLAYHGDRLGMVTGVRVQWSFSIPERADPAGWVYDLMFPTWSEYDAQQPPERMIKWAKYDLESEVSERDLLTPAEWRVSRIQQIELQEEQLRVEKLELLKGVGR